MIVLLTLCNTEDWQLRCYFLHATTGTAWSSSIQLISLFRFRAWIRATNFSLHRNAFEAWLTLHEVVSCSPPWPWLHWDLQRNHSHIANYPRQVNNGDIVSNWRPRPIHRLCQTWCKARQASSPWHVLNMMGYHAEMASTYTLHKQGVGSQSQEQA